MRPLREADLLAQESKRSPGALGGGIWQEGQPRRRSDILTLKEVSSLRKKFRRGESGIRSGMIGEPKVRPYSWATQRVAPTEEIFI